MSRTTNLSSFTKRRSDVVIHHIMVSLFLTEEGYGAATLTRYQKEKVVKVDR